MQQSVNAAALAGFYGTGPVTRSIDVGVSLPRAYGITQVDIQSRVGTSGYGIGVYTRIYALPSLELLVTGGPQNAGPNEFGGVADPGLSAVWDSWQLAAGARPRRDITGFRLELWCPDGSGVQGFGEVIVATLHLARVSGLTMVL